MKKKKILLNWSKKHLFVKKGSFLSSIELYKKFQWDTAILDMSVKSFVLSLLEILNSSFKEESFKTKKKRVGPSFLVRGITNISYRDVPDQIANAGDVPDQIANAGSNKKKKRRHVSQKTIQLENLLKENVTKFIKENFQPSLGSTILFKEIFELWKKNYQFPLPISNNKFSRTFVSSWKTVSFSLELKKRTNLGEKSKDVGYENIKFLVKKV